jgi:alpha-L-rhamnosidase
MNRREVLVALGTLGSSAILPHAHADVTEETPIPAGAGVRRWLVKADELKPVLSETAQRPISLVRPVRDDSVALRYRMDIEGPADALADRVMHKGDSVIVDFTGHRAGYLSFELAPEIQGRDFPVRLRLTFGEVPTDVAEPLYPYTGVISEAWLPNEVVNFDDLPRRVRLPRRYAFRYVKIEVLDTNLGYGLRILEPRAHAVTAASKTVPALPTAVSGVLRHIDKVAIATLRDCLQTIFEDGPRRDRRLWVGDLRLQALSNYATFRANDVVKRCLYLVAALPRADGLVNACVYEHPRPTYGKVVMFDYAALYAVAVADYVEATGDLATGHELWPVVKRQLEILGKTVDANGLFVAPKDTVIFIDWSEDLDKNASMQGLLIYTYSHAYALAQRLGRTAEVANYLPQIDRMRKAARTAWFDGQRAVFLSGPDRQVSLASQAWLVLAGAARSNIEAQAAIRATMSDPHAVRPSTPYLYHYVVDAMLSCGMRKEARSLVEEYWGGMVQAGADTFWEIYDPQKPLSSPYGDIHINSYCHAWSCTPAYFIRSRALGEH